MNLQRKRCWKLQSASQATKKSADARLRKRRQVCRPFRRDAIPAERSRYAVALWSGREVKQIEQVADGWTVRRHVRVIRRGDRVGEIIPAAAGDRRQAPIPLDELEDGDMIRVLVRDMSRCVVGRHHDQRDTRTVAEEIEGV